MIPEIALLGFTRVCDFQAAWNLGLPLVVDDVAGPKTRAAAGRSARRHVDELPDISLNFSAHQFACHCGGKLEGCRKTLVRRGLLISLEGLHRILHHPIEILDGYRCPAHNKAVGGAADSQHLYGCAIDPVMTEGLARVRELQLFSGIGAKETGAHRVTHVDRRDISGHNHAGATVTRPTVWFYPG